METKRKRNSKRNSSINLTDVYLDDFSVTKLEVIRSLAPQDAPKGRLDTKVFLELSGLQDKNGFDADLSIEVKAISVDHEPSLEPTIAFVLTLKTKGRFFVKEMVRPLVDSELDETLAGYVTSLLYPIAITLMNQNILLMGYKSAILTIGALGSLGKPEAETKG